MIITIDGPAVPARAAPPGYWQSGSGSTFSTRGPCTGPSRSLPCAGIDLGNQDALAALLSGLRLEMPSGRVVLNGEDITGLIRTSAITAASGPIADSRVVREHLVHMQRAIAAGRDMVCEGRDQGTVVFPDAACKFFLVADPVERARRRQREQAARGETVTLAEVLRTQEARDRRDAARDLAPMVPAADAVELDTTQLSLDQVVDRMEQEVRLRAGRTNLATD